MFSPLNRRHLSRYTSGWIPICNVLGFCAFFMLGPSILILHLLKQSFFWVCNLLLLFLILYFSSLSSSSHTEVSPSLQCCCTPCSSSTVGDRSLHGADPSFSVIITFKDSSFFASKAVLIQWSSVVFLENGGSFFWNVYFCTFRTIIWIKFLHRFPISDFQECSLMICLSGISFPVFLCHLLFPPFLILVLRPLKFSIWLFNQFFLSYFSSLDELCRKYLDVSVSFFTFLF